MTMSTWVVDKLEVVYIFFLAGGKCIYEFCPEAARSKAA